MLQVSVNCSSVKLASVHTQFDASLFDDLVQALRQEKGSINPVSVHINLHFVTTQVLSLIPLYHNLYKPYGLIFVTSAVVLCQNKKMKKSL